MRGWLTGASCVVVLLAGITGGVPPAGANHEPEVTPSPTPIVGSPLLQPAIEPGAAQELALEGQGGAHVAEVDLDGNAGLLAYQITLDNGIVVRIDATTGEILGTERADPPGDEGARRGDRAAAAGKGDEDDGATSARQGRHGDDDRSKRRGDRDDDERARRRHHAHDDKLGHGDHHGWPAEKATDPASTGVTSDEPCQCAAGADLADKG